GFVEADESLEAAARRELFEETGVKIGPLRSVGGFGDPGRDPRGWTISIAYYGFVAHGVKAKAADDARGVGWHPVRSTPSLAFDHAKIMACFLDRLRVDLYSTTAVAPLFDVEFTLGELITIYEMLDPDAPAPATLKRRLTDSGVLTAGSRRGRLRFVEPGSPPAAVEE
ncbi:MAG: NUDIX hydrolase, partial [Planctomycetia bacterium]